MSDIKVGDIGAVGNYALSFTDGKFVLSVTIGPKEILDLLAVKIGGPIPAEIATFIENAFGLK